MVLHTSNSQEPNHVPTDLEVAETLVGSEKSHEPKDSAAPSYSDGASNKEKESRDSTATSSSTSSVHETYDPSKLYALPPQIGPRWYRAFRWQFFTVYRKIYTVVFLLNLTWGLVGLSVYDFGDSIYASGRLVSDSLATAVAANIMAAIVMRNEHVINALFSTCIAAPHWTPLWFRTAMAMVYSYGGFHSGCATASAAWYAIYTGVAIREYTSSRQPSPVFVVLASLLLTLLTAIITLALPPLRAAHHNHFERVHRFAGWTVLALFWAQLIASAILTGRTSHRPAGLVLATTPAFWFLTVATLFVAYPWLRLRRRAVDVEPLSAHAVRLHFPSRRPPRLCSAIRISDRPWLENHSFATIPNNPPRPSTSSSGTSSGAGGFSLVVSRAGDWTSRLISTHPHPTSLYVRSGPAQGMAAVTNLFSPVVLLATGSGIGPCLGFFAGKPAGHPGLRVIWSTRDPEKTYGRGIIDAVREADPRAVIVDTDKVGRPDIVGLAYGVWRESGAEAVCVISNKKVVDMVVFGLESRGVSAFGPIWDS